MEITEKIFKYVKGLDWGKALNKIQDVVLKVLNDKECEEYLDRTHMDVQMSKGTDCLIMNGDYYDWKEFETKRDNIILSYLGYFNSDELTRISQAI